MVDFTSGIDLEGLSPYEKVLRQCKAKVTNRADGYPSKYLLEWCEAEDAKGRPRGGLHVFTFSGEDPRIEVPAPSDCPAILIWLAPSPEVSASYNRTAPRDDDLTLRFELWLYTDDQEEMLRFAWLFKCALTKPFMTSGFDLLAGPSNVPELDYYWQSAPNDFQPWGQDDEAPEAFSLTTDFTFRMLAELFK